MVETISNIFQSFWQTISNYLPGSPFRQFSSLVNDIPFLENLNWVFPISEAITVLEAWLAVITIFFGFSAILRFIRLIR